MLGLKWVCLLRWLVVDQCSESQIQIRNMLKLFSEINVGIGVDRTR